MLFRDSNASTCISTAEIPYIPSPPGLGVSRCSPLPDFTAPVFSVLLLVVGGLGLLANLVEVTLMALQYQHQQQKNKKKKDMPMTSSRSQACVFMLNLSAADFLASICATPWALYVIHGYDWRLGELACGMSLSLFSASVYGSTLFVLLICVERYLATAHPLDFTSLRSRRTSLVSSFLGWVLVSLLVAHNFSNIVHRGPDPGREGASYCGLSLTTDFSTARSSVAFFLSFGATTVAPLAVIIPCYARVVGVVLRSERMRRDRRGRARALRLVTAVVTTFLLTFVPLQMFMLGMYVVAWTRLSCADPCQAARAVNAINETVMVLSVMNACTDPFVYFMNETDLAAVWLRGGRGPSFRRRSVLLRRFRLSRGLVWDKGVAEMVGGAGVVAISYARRGGGDGDDDSCASHVMERPRN